jgi:tetratricopeptide (TPR) repeat protein
MLYVIGKMFTNMGNVWYCFVLAVAATMMVRAQSTDGARVKAEQAFINGATLQLMENKHAEAILEFQESLRYDSSAVTLVSIARSFYQLHRYDRALDAVQEALRLDSANGEAIELQAELLVYDGKYDSAVSSYERILTIQPTARQLYTLAQLYEPRDATKAIEIYERIAATWPNENVFQRIADLYERKRSIRQWQQWLLKGARFDSLNVAAARRALLASLEVHAVDTALSLVEAWLQPSRSSYEQFIMLSTMLEYAIEDSVTFENIRLRLREFSTIVETAHKSQWMLTSAMAILANRSGMLGLRDRMLEHISQTTNISVERFLFMTREFSADNSYEPAEAILAEAELRYPAEAQIPYYRGWIAINLRQRQNAIRWFRRSIEVDPTYVDALLALAAQYEQKEAIDSAMTIYEQALQANSDHPMANNNFAYFLAVQNKDLLRAQRMSWTALQQQPREASFLDTYAWVLYKLGSLDLAERYMKLAIEYEGSSVHYEHMGDIYHALGRPTDAQEMWKQSLLLDPSQRDVEQKIKELQP